MKHRILAGAVAVAAMVAAPLTAGTAAAAETTTLGIPIHSRSIRDNGDGTFDLTYHVEGKSNPSVVHLGGDVVTVFDNSGSMGEYASQIQQAASQAEAKALADPNKSLPAAQQNRGAFGSYDGLVDMGGGPWTADPDVFSGSASSTGSTSYTLEGLNAIENADQSTRSDGGEKIAVIIGMFDANQGDELERMKALAKKGWEWRIVAVNGGTTEGKGWADGLTAAGYKAKYYQGIDSIAGLYNEIGLEQATAWRVANVSITDDYGPYVDPVDTNAVITCVDRSNVEPGEDATGCDKAPKPDDIKTSWDAKTRRLTVAFPDKGEIGAKAMYDITVKVKVNDAGVKHYEESGYKYDGFKGEANTGDTAGRDGYPVSQDGGSILNYAFFRNGVQQGEMRATTYANPAALVGRLESTLTYEPNGAKGSIPPVTAEHAATVKTADGTAYTWPGHRFTGWNSKADGTGTAVRAGDGITLNAKTQTLYAQWEEMPATLSYQANSDKAQGTVDGAKGLDSDKVKIADNAYTWPGHRFTGWNTAKDGSGTSARPGAEWTLKEGDTVLYAQWETRPATLSYDRNSDKAQGTVADTNGLDSDKVTVADNGFSWPGHRFLSWNTKTDGTGDTIKPGSEWTLREGLTTLYAQWEEMPAILSYDANSDKAQGTVDGAKGLDSDKVKVADNAYTWPGHRFTGWNTAKDGSGTAARPGVEWTLREGDTVLYAQWEEMPATLSYQANSDAAQGAVDGAKGLDSDKVTVADNGFSWAGHRFLSWNTKADGTGDTIEPGSEWTLREGDAILYAQWEEMPATLSYQANSDAAQGMVDPAKGLDSYKVTVADNAFTWPGRTFTGWNTKADGTGDTIEPGSEWTLHEGDVILYAQWKANPSTLAYLPGDPDVTGDTPAQTGLVDDTVRVADSGFAWIGHTFLGWRPVDASKTDDDPAVDDPADASPDTPSEDGDVTDSPDDTSGDDTGDGTGRSETGSDTTAPVSPIALDDGSADDPESQSVGGSAASDPSAGETAVEEGADGSTTSDALIHPGDERVLTVEGETLEAVWRANTYTVAYDRNGEGATGDMADQTMAYDHPENLTANAYARAGYTFEGWNTKPDGTGTAYKDRAEVRNLTAADGGRVTLYAQWKPVPLPQTGMAMGIIIPVIALIAILAGGAAVVVSRRRNR